MSADFLRPAMAGARTPLHVDVATETAIPNNLNVVADWKIMLSQPE
jgi:hypothetical protein